MALSRIWSAFIIIAIVVAAIRSMTGDSSIFNRMVVGKSSDSYDTVYYYAVGSPVKQGLASNYHSFLKEYGYVKVDSIGQANVLLSDNISPDSVDFVTTINPSVKVYTYKSIQAKLERKTDGIKV